MARKWSNQNLPGALHFVTGNFLDRVPVFNREACCQSFIDALAKLLKDWPCKLIAYVLMPDHLHLIVNPRDGRIREFTGTLKSRSARAIVDAAPGIEFKLDSEGSHQVWQQSFKATPLWSGWMIWQKINYIHANPVKARLVSSAKDYRWSSFRAFYSGSGEPLAVEQDWWWADDSEKLSKERLCHPFETSRAPHSFCFLLNDGLLNDGFFHTSSSNLAVLPDWLLLPMFGNEFANNRNQFSRHTHNDFGMILKCSFVFGNCFYFGLGLIVREKSIDTAFIPTGGELIDRVHFHLCLLRLRRR